MAAKPVVGIEASDWGALQRDLKKANAGALKLFRAAAKKGADVVVRKAQAAIGPISSRIPYTIKSGATNKGAYVRAGGKGTYGDAPHAAAFENEGKEGTFRHPVFGNRDNWVSQEAHPYLLPSLTEDVLQQVMDDFLDALTGEAGFK